MTFPLKWSFCFPCLSFAISISRGFGELSEQQELLEHGNQVVHLGWTSREMEKQQKGRKIMSDGKKHPLSPARGMWVHPSAPQESSPAP